MCQNPAGPACPPPARRLPACLPACLPRACRRTRRRPARTPLPCGRSCRAACCCLTCRPSRLPTQAAACWVSRCCAHHAEACPGRSTGFAACCQVFPPRGLGVWSAGRPDGSAAHDLCLISHVCRLCRLCAVALSQRLHPGSRRQLEAVQALGGGRGCMPRVAPGLRMEAPASRG